MNQEKPSRRSALACLSGCVVGALIAAAGLGWSVFGDARAVYTTEQAEEWEQANAALHAASIPHNHGPSTGGAASDDEDGAKLAAARARFERANAALQSARFVKDRLGALLAWIGLAIAGAFGVGYLVIRGDAS